MNIANENGIGKLNGCRMQTDAAQEPLYVNKSGCSFVLGLPTCYAHRETKHATRNA